MNNPSDFTAPQGLFGFKNILLVIGVLGLIAWVIGATMDTEQALRSWLLGFIFWGGLGFGSLGILILQYLTGGAWGVVVRRLVEAGARSIWLIALFFIPLLFGATKFYLWATEEMQHSKSIMERGWYLTFAGWAIRAVGYFVILLIMQVIYDRFSKEQDAASDYEAAGKVLGSAGRFSGPTMVVYCLVISFAAIDWVMTMDPHWFSTIWGFLFIAGWGLSTFAFLIAVLSYLSDKEPFVRVIGKKHFHDIGKLMLAFVMIWAYFNFSQYLIIWSGNLPEETSWYLTRTKGGWGVVSVILIVLHFVFPFLVLLQQDFKRKVKAISILAIFILVMRIVDMYYIIGPMPRQSGEAHGFSVHWLDFVAPIAIGGIWLWYYFGQLSKVALVPVKDPYFESAIEHGHGH